MRRGGGAGMNISKRRNREWGMGNGQRGTENEEWGKGVENGEKRNGETEG